MIAVCGYDCSNCPLYKATIAKNVEEIKKILFIGPNVDVTIESHGCLGCKSETVSQCCKTCYMKKCTQAKHLDSCGKCIQYPCDYVKNNLSVDSRKVLDKINKTKSQNKVM